MEMPELYKGSSHRPQLNNIAVRDRQLSTSLVEVCFFQHVFRVVVKGSLWQRCPELSVPHRTSRQQQHVNATWP